MYEVLFCCLYVLYRDESIQAVSKDLLQYIGIDV